MGVELISILGLLIMFIIASIMPINLGVLGFVAAYIVGNVISGMGVKDIFGVFPADLFIILAGVTYLFAIVQNNGTIDLITNWGLKAVRGNVGLVPWVMFALSTILTSVGTLGPATVAILAPIALRFAAQHKISPLLMGIFVVQGSTAGSYSPINPIGVIIHGVLNGRNLPSDPGQLFVNALIFSIFVSLFVFILLGGIRLLKRKSTPESLGSAESEVAATATEEVGLTWYRAVTLAGIILIVVLTLGFNANIGFTSFMVGLVLAMLAPKEQSGVLARMPWSVILLISGIVTYVGVMEEVGTIDYLTELIASVGNSKIAALAASYVGGVVSSFASTTGILAAILPIVAPILQDPTVSAIGVISAIAIASIIVDLSPFSTNGALLLANVQGVPERVFFKQLLIFAVLVVAFGPAITWFVFVFLGIF